MRFFTGQPAAWQKGMPQSMQRAACSLSTRADQRPVDLVPVLDPLADGAMLDFDRAETA